MANAAAVAISLVTLMCSGRPAAAQPDFRSLVISRPSAAAPPGEASARPTQQPRTAAQARAWYETRPEALAAQAPAASQTQAEAPAAQTGALSLDEAWRIALEKNLALGQQALLLQQSQEELRIQRAEYLPSLSATGTYGYTSKVAKLQLELPIPGLTLPQIQAGTRDRYDAAATVDLPVFTGFRIENQVRAAEQQLRAQTARKESLRSQILLLVGQLYFQIQQNELQQQAIEQAVERAGHHLEMARSMYLAKQATTFDTLEVANRKLQLESQFEMLVNLHEVLASKLGHAINVTFAPRVVPAAVETADLSLGELNQYLEQALRERPELRETSSLEKGQLFRMRAVRASQLPQLYANASYHYARPGVNFFEDKWMEYYTVNLSIRWQLWNWLQDQREVRKARLDYERLGLQVEQLRLDVRQQVTEAYQQLKTARQQIELQRRLVEQEKERYRITRENYQQASATSLDLSMAENTLTSAELTLRQNYMEWFGHKLELQFATGAIGKESLD
jgi:outer membrane protein TolC